MEEYEILYRNTPHGLTQIVNKFIELGWERIGSHQVVTTNMTNRFSGCQIHGSNYEVQYSQTMIKKLNELEALNKIINAKSTK